VRHLALFICGFLKAHLDLLEQGDQMAQKSLGVALVLLLRLSRVDDVVIFKICLEYWVVLVTQLYESIKFTNRPPLLVGLKQDVNPRLRMYAKDLSELRKVMISKMSRPEEVLVCEDDNGQVVRVSMKDTDSIVLYKNMRECLIYLTHLDPQDTQETMLLKLSKQVDDSEWSWHNLNTLCWAIGSISGALTEMNEKTFLVRVIKDLLGLCENKRGKDHKAIIASNIMYVVGQYPRFLRQHWRFLKTVVNKLFEFMHEKHPGVQDMSCDTFLKIARTCRRKFVMLQKGEARPFVEDILDGLTEKIVDLEQSQIHTFYEAVATIIQSQSDPDKRNALVFRLMEVPNKAWNRIVVEARRMMEAHQNPAILWEPENVKRVVLVLKTNNRVASSLGHAYMVQLSRVYVEMLQMYQMYSQFVSMKIQENVGNSQNTLIRSMRAVKKETLKLIMSFVETCQETDKEIVFQKFIPELMTPVLQDYQRNVAEARDAEVLTLFATIANKLQRAIVPHVPAILEATMKCTLEMITKNYEDYPDHRMAFFKLIREINHEAFPALLSLNAAQFQMVIDSIVYAMKHLERNIADTGLNILLELLKNVENVDVANDFFKTYFNRLLQDLLSVLTDAFHKPGFRLQAQILAKLFNIVDSSCITSQLWQPEQGNFANNQEYVRGFVLNLIATSFKNLNRQQVEAFTNGLFHHNADLTAFKSHLRDFLVTLKEFASEGNNSDLFLEERNAQIQAQQSENQQRVMQVPGLLYQGPSSGIIPKELPENS
jgi:exportin-1